MLVEPAMKTRALIILSLIACMILTGCEKKPASTAIEEMNAQQLISAAENAAVRAQKTSSKKKIKQWATKGRLYADRCVEIAPEDAACYYWRTVNTGLYYQAKVIGYQRGIKQMIADCNKVIELGKANFDHAGPYRIQGEIFTRLPQTGGSPDSVIRDLDKAQAYLWEAVRIAPDYPENRIALAEVLYRQNRYDEAFEQLSRAQQDVPAWRRDTSYHEWQKTIANLMKKIEKKQH